MVRGWGGVGVGVIKKVNKLFFFCWIYMLDIRCPFLIQYNKKNLNIINYKNKDRQKQAKYLNLSAIAHRSGIERRN